MRKLLTALLLTLAATALLSTLLAGCESSPQAPVYENIFDPDGPEGGNPLGLTASIQDSLKILLTWSQPQDYNIDRYEISHSTTPAEGYLGVGTVTQTTQSGNSFTYRGAEPTSAHYFRIKAYNGDNEFTNLGGFAHATQVTPPLVLVNGGQRRIGSRNITLDITVTQGDSLRIWVEEAPESTITVAAPEPAVPGQYPFSLPQVAGNDSVFNLRVLATPLNVATETAEITLTVDFDPVFTVEPDSAAVASRDLELIIPAQGIVFMRFADTREELESLPWQSYAAVRAYRIDDSANRQVVWGEFMSDFGFSAVASLGVTPATLEDASFALDLGPDDLSESAQVTILCDAGASEMRFGESPDLAAAPWQPYAEEFIFTLSPEAGHKTIYGQFRNDWARSPVLTDHVVYLSQGLEVGFVAPMPGDTLTGGVPLQVRGTALASSSIDSVQFDAGDGLGFRPAEGTEEWTYLWDVPEVEALTERVLRARAFADDDSVTTTCTVQIQPEVTSE